MTRKYPKTTEIHTLTASEKSAIEHQYEIDHQIVKGVFKNYRHKNNPVRFVYRKYLQDPIKWYPENKQDPSRPAYFIDGQTYEIPLMVANHLNNDCFIPIHENAQDANGKPLPETIVGTKQHRFGFVNTDFRPVAGWKDPSPIVKVTTMSPQQ